MEIVLKTKDPEAVRYPTWGVCVEYDPCNGDETTILKALGEQLSAAGFERSRNEPPAVPGFDAEADFFKPGTGLFRGWTDQEYRANLDQLTLIFEKFPSIPVSMAHLTLQDVL